MKIHPAAAKVITVLEAHGYEAWVVGGCVRDSLLGRQPQDWDICTSALPQEGMACFCDFPVVETGLKHGTFTVLLEGTACEVTTFRTDGPYLDSRRPEHVVFVRGLEEDLARRDFTINAMAWHPGRGLADPFGGRQDLVDKLLRSVGRPDMRLREDALRILRALRFASQLEFSIVPALEESLHKNRQLLLHVASERIRAELDALLAGPGVLPVLLAYPDVLAVFMPEIEAMAACPQNNRYHVYNVWRHTAHAVAAAPGNRQIRLAMLLHDVGKPPCRTTGPDGSDHFYGHPAKSAQMAEKILKRLKYDKATARAVVELVAWHDAELHPANLRRLLARLGEERLRQLLLVRRADAAAQSPLYKQERFDMLAQAKPALESILAQQQCFKRADLAVDGNDLLKLGVPRGPAMGHILARLLEQVVEEKLPNEKTALLAEAQQLAGIQGNDTSGTAETGKGCREQ